MEHIISTFSLTKRYGEKLACDNVNITISRGDIYGLIGRNGAGKTTVLKMIADLIKPTKGRVDINLSKKEKSVNDIGILIESPGIILEFDAKSNIDLKCAALGIKKSGYAEELLKLVGLEGVKKKAREFSLGMKQRLGLAIALIGDPEVLILDEPTNGMDPQGMLDFRNLIKKLVDEKQITIIISSHILDELSKIATRFGIIEQGKLIKEISSKELSVVDRDKIELKVENPQAALEVLKSAFNLTKYEILEDNKIYIFEDLDTSLINKKLCENNIFLDEIFTTHQSLENFYLNLTGGALDA